MVASSNLNNGSNNGSEEKKPVAVGNTHEYFGRDVQDHSKFLRRLRGNQHKFWIVKAMRSYEIEKNPYLWDCGEYSMVIMPHWYQQHMPNGFDIDALTVEMYEGPEDEDAGYLLNGDGNNLFNLGHDWEHTFGEEGVSLLGGNTEQIQAVWEHEYTKGGYKATCIWVEKDTVTDGSVPEGRRHEGYQKYSKAYTHEKMEMQADFNYQSSADPDFRFGEALGYVYAAAAVYECLGLTNKQKHVDQAADEYAQELEDYVLNLEQKLGMDTSKRPVVTFEESTGG